MTETGNAEPAPVRVLWLIKGLGPGGAETLLVSAARVADHRRFAYEAAYLVPWKDQLVPRLEDNGVTVHCLHGPRELSLGWVRRLRRLLRRGRFDVVHLHSPMVAGVARLLVLLTMSPRHRPAIVSTEHNAWWSYSRPTRWLNRATQSLDSQRWAVSEDVRSTMSPAARARTDVLVHGLVLDDARSAVSARNELRRELGVGPGEVLIGTLANYRPQKGYPDLLRAARLVVDAEPSARFVAAGQGPLQAEVESLHAELALEGRFQLVGYRSDPLSLLSACDVFVLASLHEGLPVAAMEALALGLPIISTAAGGMTEIVDEGVNGFLTPVGDPVLLATRIQHVVRDEELRTRLSAASARRGRRFDIRTAVTLVERAYIISLRRRVAADATSTG